MCLSLSFSVMFLFIRSDFPYSPVRCLALQSFDQRTRKQSWCKGRSRSTSDLTDHEEQGRVFIPVLISFVMKNWKPWQEKRDDFYSLRLIRPDVCLRTLSIMISSACFSSRPFLLCYEHIPNLCRAQKGKLSLRGVLAPTWKVYVNVMFASSDCVAKYWMASSVNDMA